MLERSHKHIEFYTNNLKLHTAEHSYKGFHSDSNYDIQKKYILSPKEEGAPVKFAAILMKPN